MTANDQCLEYLRSLRAIRSARIIAEKQWLKDNEDKAPKREYDSRTFGYYKLIENNRSIDAVIELLKS